jgi:uncharacterized protein (TIGR03067 family)
LVSLVLATEAGRAQEAAGKKPVAARIDSLIRQLGNEQFVRREAASKELERIGEPALPALRQAAAASQDPEIVRRAEQIIRAFTGRIAAKVLRELEGTWSLVTLEGNGAQVLGEDKARTFTFKGGRFELKHRNMIYQAGSVTVIDPFASPRSIDVIVLDGGSVYLTVAAICQVEGDTLKYCGSLNGAARPKAFGTKAGDGSNYSIWKRVKQ